MGKKKTPSAEDRSKQVGEQASQAYQTSLTPSATETAYQPVNQQFQQQYDQAAQRQTQDYGKLMSGYDDFRQRLAAPTKFSFQNVQAQRPAELGESYGYLREAMPGYREFAQTGGYSPTDIQELRARGISPIRAAYGNTMMELDRARALGGNAGAPNYIAALSRAQRELPEQLASATTNVNAGLADAIRQGKLAGLGGMTNVGGTMGGLASGEAGRQLQASLANQSADLQAQGMGEQSLQNRQQMDLAGLGGQANLFGTSPGMASTFGNQALNSWQQRAAMEQARQQFGLGAMDAQIRAAQMQEATKGTPWWQTALGVAGTVAPFFSSKHLKTDIKRVSRRQLTGFAKQFDKLPMYTWRYKGDSVRHFGPMAQDLKKLGIGDGTTVHPADIFGVALASGKEALAHG